MRNGPGAPRRSLLSKSPGSRRWPAPRQPTKGCRCRGGRARSWPATLSPTGICESISQATVRRWLSEDALKPWQYQSWIFISDPDFATKAGRVLDLYARVWEGKPLGANDFVISADEKTSIQARCRCHPTLPPGRPARCGSTTTYKRRGAVAYLAAYDVHRAKVFGRCEDTTGIAAFSALVEQVMTQEPYASAERVFWIVDNGSSHRGQAAIDRLAAQFPNAIMVHTPVHASWLNQVEIFFSIVQRKVLSPNDFTDTNEVIDRLAAFETHYNQTARPFKWKFTATDLADLLTRLDNHKSEHQPRGAPRRMTPDELTGGTTKSLIDKGLHGGPRFLHVTPSS